VLPKKEIEMAGEGLRKKDELYNWYNVTFVFNDCTIATIVYVKDAHKVERLAMERIITATGISEDFLIAAAQDVEVKLLGGL